MTIVQAKDAFEAGEQRVGGKAMGLARLTSANAPVPPWFVVATESFHAHLDENQIRSLIQESLDRLKKLNIQAPETLSQIQDEATKIQEAIKDAPLSASLITELTNEVAKLDGKEFAVRSSMVGEDSAEHSFAGQLDSFLFQKTATEIGDSLKACWASAFGDRSIAYHMRAQLPLDNMRVGVVVQRMIDGDVSGVMFTANPANGARDESLLTAAWGQGEGIVSGLCNTDEFVWNHDGRELNAQIVDKDIKVSRNPDGSPGTIEEAVEQEDRNRRCLSELEVSKICKEGLRVATHFGSPQDIEWTSENGKLFFVQARPITSLPVPENKDGPLVVWDNSNIQESYCGVTTPLTFTFANRCYTMVYRQVLEVLAVPPKTIDAYEPNLRNLLGIVKGRIYYNINNWYRYLLILPGFGKNKADMEKMMGLTDPVDLVEDHVLTTWEKLKRLPSLFRTLYVLKKGYRQLPKTVPAFLRHFEDSYRQMDRESFKTASFSELLNLLDGLTKRLLAEWHTPIVNDFYVMQTNGQLSRMLEKAGFDEPTSLQNNLISGEDGIESTEPTRFLMRLAKQAREDANLKKLCQEGTPLECLEKIRTGFPAFHALIEEYIERYGDRTMGELKLETISLREDPSFVIEVVRNFMERPDLDPDKLSAHEKEVRYKAEETVFAKLGPLGRWRMRRMLTKARDAVKNRENMRLSRTRAFGLARDMYRNLGRCLVDAGKLDHERDIFYLAAEELEAYHEGRCVGTDLRNLAAVRKKEFEAYENDEPPHHFETTGAVYHGNNYRYVSDIEIDENANTLKGIGCYPGIVESKIRLIFSPKDELSVNGKILVTVRTDPGWAPLFPTTSGIIVERGSTLSHSAVVARELGIPAIVGVPGLTTIVEDGEMVKMNGETGLVERLDQDETSTDDQAE